MKTPCNPNFCRTPCEADEYQIAAELLPIISDIDSGNPESSTHVIAMTQVDMWNRIQDEASRKACEGYGKIPTKVLMREEPIMCPVVARVLGEMGFVE